MKKLKKLAASLTLLLAISLTSLNAYTSAVETTGEGYKTYTIDGRYVLFEDDLVERDALRRKVAEWITIDLKDIELKIPEKAWDSIKHVSIWIDYTTEPTGSLTGRGACYFNGPWFLVTYKWPMQKEENIEIFDAYQYIGWRGGFVGQVVLHELGHAYEDQVLNDAERRELVKVYQCAKLSGIYDFVKRTGEAGYKEAYAMYNYHEYFTELTEAYFGNNDFFPHTAEQLERHDPQGYALIDRLWNR